MGVLSAMHVEELQRRGRALDKRLRDLRSRHRYDLMAACFDQMWECAAEEYVIWLPPDDTVALTSQRALADERGLATT